MVWVRLTLTCDGKRSGVYRKGGSEDVITLLRSEAIASFFQIKGMGVGEHKLYTTVPGSHKSLQVILKSLDFRSN